MRHAFSFGVIAFCLALPTKASAIVWNRYDNKPLEWFRTEDAGRVAANVLAWQTERGDWPNDVSSAEPYDATRDRKTGSFDDGHTTGDLRFLARMYRATDREAYRDAALKAIELVLSAQYPNGGFPQSADPGDGYQRYITFNDQAMVDLLALLRDIATTDDFAFVGSNRKQAAQAAFQGGIDCIVKCQIVIDGRRTIWAAQHDEVTFAPRPARAFEPPALATAESTGVLRLLMSLDDPSPDVARAVNDGVQWFRDHQITGLQLVRGDDDTRVEPDPDAPPLWARFYDLESEQPIFAGRNGVVRDSLAEIERERRTGYAWYGEWGTRVLERYEAWPHQGR